MRTVAGGTWLTSPGGTFLSGGTISARTGRAGKRGRWAGTVTDQSDGQWSPIGSVPSPRGGEGFVWVFPRVLFKGIS